MRVLLVEPKYYSRYPPLGLLKFSAFHKGRGDKVRFVRGTWRYGWDPRETPDLIYVTSLFTWAWHAVRDAVMFYHDMFPRAKILLGGVYASLMPDHAARTGADQVVTGIRSEVEDLMPDYSLAPQRWNASILFSSRGCIRRCKFCAVPYLEGRPTRSQSIRHLIHPKHRKVILWDNNILGVPNWEDLVEELKELNLEVDFNQGLDARLITERVAMRLKGLRMPIIRIAYDNPGMGHAVKAALDHLDAVGFRRNDVVSYVLFNYKDSPDDLFVRVRDLLELGATAYPMRFQPLNGPGALEKDSYVAPSWTQELLNMVAKARRVIGYGGAFPPYEGLRKKFAKARNFEEAFGLWEPHQRPGAPRDEEDSHLEPVVERELRQMALEHAHDF
jgi:hypothetical protein